MLQKRRYQMTIGMQKGLGVLDIAAEQNFEILDKETLKAIVVFIELVL